MEIQIIKVPLYLVVYIHIVIAMRLHLHICCINYCISYIHWGMQTWLWLWRQIAWVSRQYSLLTFHSSLPAHAHSAFKTTFMLNFTRPPKIICCMYNYFDFVYCFCIVINVLVNCLVISCLLYLRGRPVVSVVLVCHTKIGPP